MIRYRSNRPGFSSGKAMVMITRWEGPDDKAMWDAEIYPHNGEIIAEAKTLGLLLLALTKHTAMNDILSRT